MWQSKQVHVGIFVARGFSDVTSSLEEAYIADIDAGTFRQLVEAAEACQVSIIHPGKARNPNELGLSELIARAEPFQ